MTHLLCEHSSAGGHQRVGGVEAVKRELHTRAHAKIEAFSREALLVVAAARVVRTCRRWDGKNPQRKTSHNISYSKIKAKFDIKDKNNDQQSKIYTSVLTDHGSVSDVSSAHGPAGGNQQRLVMETHMRT